MQSRRDVRANPEAARGGAARAATLALLAAALAGCPAPAKPREALIRAGDREAAAQRPRSALAYYDRARTFGDDPDLAARRQPVALAFTEQQAEAAAALAKTDFAAGFGKLLALRDKAGFGAQLPARFFEDRLDALAVAWWESIERAAQLGLVLAAMTEAERLAGAFPEPHWTHERRDVLRRRFAASFGDERPDRRDPVNLLRNTLLRAIGADLGARPSLRDGIRRRFTPGYVVSVEASSSCREVANAVVAEDTAEEESILEPARVVLRLRSCSAQYADVQVGRTVTETVQVPYEAEGYEDVEIEEQVDVPYEVHYCVESFTRNGQDYCSAPRARWETRKETRTRTVRRPTTVIKYRDEQVERTVMDDITRVNTTTEGEMIVTYRGRSETRPVSSASTVDQPRGIARDGAVTGAVAQEAGAGLARSSVGQPVLALLQPQRDAAIAAMVAEADAAAARGQVLEALAGYLGGRSLGVPVPGLKAQLARLGFAPSDAEWLLDDQPPGLGRPYAAVAVDEPFAFSIAEESAYFEHGERGARRRQGAVLEGVDLAYRYRTTPVEGVGGMTSVDVAWRMKSQYLRLGVGARTLGGDTAGLRLDYGIRGRTDGGAVHWGMYLEGESDDGQGHLGFGFSLAYVARRGPLSLGFRIDPNLLQLFAGTGEDGRLRLTELGALADLPLGPLFVQAGASYFLGGSAPLSLQASLGYRLVLDFSRDDAD